MLAQTGTFLINEAFTRVLSLSLDFFVFLGFIALVLGYALYRGKRKTIATLLALHITGLLFVLFPYWDFFSDGIMGIGEWESFAVKGLLFVIVLLVIRSILSGSTQGNFSGNRVRRLMEAVTLSIVIVGSFFAYGYRFLSVETVYQFSPPLDVFFATLFATPVAPFWWLLASFFTLYFIHKSKE